MPFAQMMRDTLILVKQDGSRLDDIKGSVQKGKIYIMRGDISVEPGDELHRAMPAGKFEEYIVIEPNFRQWTHGIPSHYQTEVRRKNNQFAQPAKTSPQTVNYNLYGNNSRVNNDSIDQSYNVAGSDESVKQILELLTSARKEIESTTLPANDMQTAATTLEIVESQIQAKSPSRPVLKTLLGGLPALVQVLPSVVKLVELFKDWNSAATLSPSKARTWANLQFFMK